MGTRQPKYSKVIPIAMMKGEDAQDTKLLYRMLEEAKAYILSHKWCAQIAESFFGLGVGGVVAVFLFRIVPNGTEVDDHVWVVVGDLPPLYITLDDAPNPACALDGYIGAMIEWADAASSGRTTEGLVPVAAAATPENGIDLKSRLDFIDKEILEHYRDDLT